MNKTQLEEIRSFLRGSQKEKEGIFLSYLEKFEDDINFKKKHFKRYLDSTEVDTDAIFAIEEMFIEIDSIISKAENKARTKTMSKVNVKNIFNKHLMRFSRENKIENQPLTQVIKLEFGKTVKKKVYDGYEHCLAVFTDEGLVDNRGQDEGDKERHSYVKDVMDYVANDIGTNIYKDFMAHFIDGETLRSIAALDRNKNVTKQEIHRRLKHYINKAHKKINLENKYGII